MTLSKCNLLGAMDAEVTKNLLDYEKTSHKFYIASNFEEAILQKGARKLYSELLQNYLLSFEKVEYRADANFPGDIWASFGIYVPDAAEAPLPKGKTIDG